MLSNRHLYHFLAVRSDLVKTLNETYSSLSMRRRYEVWFLRVGLADGGALWLRYLLLNPGRHGCMRANLGHGSEAGPNQSRSMPVQLWATWFPSNGVPETSIQGFPIEALNLSPRGANPFLFRVSNNEMRENFCSGKLECDQLKVSWELHYRSNFQATLSNKGWIGFSHTPHSDATFSGRLTVNDRTFEGDPLGHGLQGHNCGYRHRGFWKWAHAYFAGDRGASTLEALAYEMPFGLVFRKAVLWHDGKKQVFRNLFDTTTDATQLQWCFHCHASDGLELEANFKGDGASLHSLPYLKTDCSGTFDVRNNSRSNATLTLRRHGSKDTELTTSTGAVLEMAGACS